MEAYLRSEDQGEHGDGATDGNRNRYSRSDGTIVEDWSALDDCVRQQQLGAMRAPRAAPLPWPVPQFIAGRPSDG